MPSLSHCAAPVPCCAAGCRTLGQPPDLAQDTYRDAAPFAQTHTVGTCPIDAGGREVLREKPENVPGLKILAAFRNYTEHILYYIVKADG